MAAFLSKIHEKKISSSIAKNIFSMLCTGEKDIDAIIEREGYQQQNDNSALEEIVEQIIKQYPEQVTEYKAGKEKLLAFFIGQAMKQTKGKANPEQINLLLKKHLG